MTIAKRIFLFVLVNVFVLITLSIVFNILTAVFGIPVGYPYLIAYSLIFGFGGAFISLFMSKWIAKRAKGVEVIDPNTQDPTLRRLVDIVYGLARRAQLPKMPEVGIYRSQEVNAFATGPSKRNALVAVSTGLLNRMDVDQIEGVLGHEITHVANGDMVTMTLLQGVINSCVYFLANIVANSIAGNRRNSGLIRFGLVFALEIAFSFLGMFVISAFSRKREFRADAGGAKYAGREKMISALRALEGMQALVDPTDRALASFKIAGRPRSAIMAMLATHPPLEERIRHLERNSLETGH